MHWLSSFLNKFKRTSIPQEVPPSIQPPSPIEPIFTLKGVDSFILKWESRPWMSNLEFEQNVALFTPLERCEFFNRCLSYKFNSAFFQERILQDKLDILLKLGMQMVPDSLGRYPFQTLCVRQTYQYGDEKQINLCEQQALNLLKQTDLDAFFDGLFFRLSQSNQEKEPTLWNGLYNLIEGHYHKVLEYLSHHPQFSKWIEYIDQNHFIPILFRAVWAKNIPGFELLLQKGADPNRWLYTPDTHEPSQSLLYFLLFEMDKNPNLNLPHQYFLKPFLSKDSIKSILKRQFELALEYGADAYGVSQPKNMESPYHLALRVFPEQVETIRTWSKYYEDKKALQPLLELPVSQNPIKNKNMKRL